MKPKVSQVRPNPCQNLIPHGCGVEVQCKRPGVVRLAGVVLCRRCYVAAPLALVGREARIGSLLVGLVLVLIVGVAALLLAR